MLGNFWVIIQVLAAKGVLRGKPPQRPAAWPGEGTLPAALLRAGGPRPAAPPPGPPAARLPPSPLAATTATPGGLGPVGAVSRRKAAAREDLQASAPLGPPWCLLLAACPLAPPSKETPLGGTAGQVRGSG